MPEFFGEFIQVEPAQDVIKGFSAHIGAEDLSPALFQFAIAGLTQESEWAEFHQFITLQGIRVMTGGGLVFQLAAQGIHLLISCSLDRCSFHLDGIQGVRFLILELIFDGFQPPLDELLDFAKVGGSDLDASIDDHGASAAKYNGFLEHLALYFPGDNLPAADLPG